MAFMCASVVRHLKHKNIFVFFWKQKLLFSHKKTHRERREKTTYKFSFGHEYIQSCVYGRPTPGFSVFIIISSPNLRLCCVLSLLFSIHNQTHTHTTLCQMQNISILRVRQHNQATTTTANQRINTYIKYQTLL